MSNLFADKATATAKLSAYSDYFKTHDETSQPIKVFIIHYNVIAHKIKTENRNLTKSLADKHSVIYNDIRKHVAFT